MKRTKNYNEEDWYILNSGRLFLPTKDTEGNDVKVKYAKLGITIDNSIEEECVCLNPPKDWKAYMDGKQFNRQHDFIKGYHSVVVDEKDEVVIQIWTKRMGMRMLEYEVLDIKEV